MTDAADELACGEITTERHGEISGAVLVGTQRTVH